MNPPTLDRRQARQLDRRAVEEYGMHSLVLMENAGRGLADVLRERGVGGPVVVCCGKGNNGGDGFVLARHLDLRGTAAKVLLFAEPAELTGDAAANFAILQKCGLPIEVFGKTRDTALVDTASVDTALVDTALVDTARLDAALAGAGAIVDCLLGTGAAGDPRPPLDAVIERLNAQAAPKIAVDLPSGFDCDSGWASRTTIRALHTCTFVAAKPGFLIPGAEAYTGQVHVLDIGAPRKLVEECLNPDATRAQP